jgi:hypothetical protein
MLDRAKQSVGRQLDILIVARRRGLHHEGARIKPVPPTQICEGEVFG